MTKPRWRNGIRVCLRCICLKRLGGSSPLLGTKGCMAQLVRAFGLHPKGPWFESRCTHHLKIQSMRFFFGLIGIAIGFLLIWKSDWIVNNFGRIDWAEIKLGSEGGTRIFWKLVGLAVIAIAMLYMFGFIEGVIGAIFSPLFRGANF